MNEILAVTLSDIGLSQDEILTAERFSKADKTDDLQRYLRRITVC